MNFLSFLLLYDVNYFFRENFHGWYLYSLLPKFQWYLKMTPLVKGDHEIGHTRSCDGVDIHKHNISHQSDFSSKLLLFVHRSLVLFMSRITVLHLGLWRSSAQVIMLGYSLCFCLWNLVFSCLRVTEVGIVTRLLVVTIS